jgi:N,N-dimethylformamidase
VPIIGYSDPLTGRPGDLVRFMVSCESASYRADLMRLVHGDLDPRGPGFKCVVSDVKLPGNGVYPGRVQQIRRGSCVRVEAPCFADIQTFTLRVRVCPTAPASGPQALLTCWSADMNAGYGLFLGESGAPEFWVGDGGGAIERATTHRPLVAWRWYELTSSYDADTRVVKLRQDPLRPFPADPSGIQVEYGFRVVPAPPADTPFIMAAVAAREAEGTAFCFNGKLEDPVVLAAALADLTESARTVDQAAVVAAWDLGCDPPGSVVRDCGPHGRDGQTVNAPVRAVTGSTWTGREPNFSRAPNEYRAIHFHDDDLDDAGWASDFEFRIPESLSSGFYAMHLVCNDSEDWVPFLVAPPAGGRSADVALLAPTVSYLAYANEHMVTDEERAARTGVSHIEYLDRATAYERRMFEYIVANQLHSTYDRHSDGSGVHYASSRRPLANVRPSYNKPSVYFEIPHQLGADLYLVDWLETKGIGYDVINDHLLHEEGVDLLSHYRVVITGTHPEYCSEQMLNALDTYLNAGGRLMYMGGNGFYWVTSVDPQRPYMIEVRRGEAGTRTWSASPGENYHNTTGELGGMWRSRGRAPQAMVGIGFTANGDKEGRPYSRLPASFAPDLAFIFEGVGDDPIGDFGVYLEAAAGWELDRHDARLGSPPGTRVVATATAFSDSYQHVVEEVLDGTNTKEGGPHRAEVRADLVYCEYPNGGAVFGTGSITWAGSLSHNAYDNNVSRITENVLRAFAGPGRLDDTSSPLEGPEGDRG